MRKITTLILILLFLTSTATAELTVHFLDVGQGDAAIVLCDGEAMMIDGGESKYSQLIFSYLRKTLNLSYIDVMVASHPHADHVGGLSAALNACQVGVLYTPEADYPSKTWDSVLKYADAQGTPVIIPMPGDVFDLGGATVEVLGPLWYSNNTNDLSLIMRITYGDVSFLFTGDAEWDEEHDLVEAGIDINADVLKVCHHGSSTSSSYVFLREVSPKYAVISVGEDNQYDHPTVETLSRLTDVGAVIYRTDEQGTIICTTDGTTVTFQTER